MITWETNNRTLEIETQDSLFSPENIDRGTIAMLSTVTIRPEDKLLDLGCGYGTVGLFAASQGVRQITMTDLNQKAVECSFRNIERNFPEQKDLFTVMVSDGLEKVEDNDYTLILSNPPYHADFNVPKRFIEDGFRHLATGGRMVMVTKRRTWYENKLKSVFGGVRVAEVDGYFVFTAEKRARVKESISKNAEQPDKNKLSKKLARKYKNSPKIHEKQKKKNV